ncbi:MAG: hypothetical protein KAI81_03580, partial [Candidatus Marinimicrobia bacterium]|nr:hypothetical protein [Candidatus Neomarinimicrobiota bacterium]
DEEKGEINKIWVLKPGLYKITINNEPFNSYKDFTTVYVEEGISQVLKIVIGEDIEGNPTHLMGAGVLGGSEMERQRGNFQLDNAIHTNFNYTNDNENNKNEPSTSILLNGQFESRIVYDNKPLHITFNNWVEIETINNELDEFQISYDEIKSKNTLVYYFMKNIGYYTRLDMNSHIFPTYEYGNGNYLKITNSGDTLSYHNNVDRIEIKSQFFPLIMKMGTGINYRVFNHPKASLNIRAGLGRRQDNNSNFYYNSNENGLIDSIEYHVYREWNDFDQDGTEISFVGNFQLPFNILYYTDADILIPFDTSVPYTFDWEHNINLRLFRYISIDYKLRLRNIRQDNQSEYIAKRHALFLRLTYMLR